MNLIDCLVRLLEPLLLPKLGTCIFHCSVAFVLVGIEQPFVLPYVQWLLFIIGSGVDSLVFKHRSDELTIILHGPLLLLGTLRDV